MDAKLQESSHQTAILIARSVELMSLAREDSLKAKKDTRTLSTITILGFIYLPASFVAVRILFPTRNRLYIWN
jgi:hypothetical protein